MPVSVSVEQGELLEENGATNITGLNGIAPNVILNNVALMENGGKFFHSGHRALRHRPAVGKKTQITDNTHFAVMMAPKLSTYGAMTHSQEFSVGTLRFRLDARYQSTATLAGAATRISIFVQGR